MELDVRAGLVFLVLVGSIAGGCKRAAPPAPPPPEVSVVRVQQGPVTVYESYVAQTQAPYTIEIRSQVTGLLERQAFQDGVWVAKGQTLYVIDRRPFEAQLGQAKANLAQAQANRANTQQNLKRDAKLVGENFISQQAYDNTLAQDRSAAAAVEAQRELVRVAQLNLEYATISAPREGYTSSSFVRAGALVTAQQTLLATLYSSDPMWVYFTVSEDRVLELQNMLTTKNTDQSPDFHISLADGTEYKFPGRLNFVDAAIDQKSGTLQMRISVPNPDRALRPGQFVRVTAPTSKNPNAIRIPQQAVQELQGVKSVYVVGSDNKAQQRQIESRFRIGNDWVVDSGLKPGETIIVEGTGKVTPGALVKPVPAPATAGSPPPPRETASPGQAARPSATAARPPG